MLHLLFAFICLLNYPTDTAHRTTTECSIPASLMHEEVMMQVTLYTYTLPTCFDSLNGSLGVEVTGGIPPYRYAWSNGDTTAYIDQLTAGTYTLTVTDAQSDSVVWSHILYPIDPVVIVDVYVTPESCPGACDAIIAIDAAGGDLPYTYQISGEGCAGVQTITVTDAHGCSATEDIFIWSEEGPVIVDIRITSPNPGQPDGGIEVIAFGGDSLTYSLDNVVYQSSNIFSGLAEGIYCVWVQDVSGCITKSDTVVIEALTGLPATITDVSIFPNPARDKIHLIGTMPMQLEVWDMFGRLVQTSLPSATHELPVGDLPRGIYWLEFYTQSSVGSQMVILH